jgi:hypothetical protein
MELIRRKITESGIQGPYYSISDCSIWFFASHDKITVARVNYPEIPDITQFRFLFNEYSIIMMGDMTAEQYQKLIDQLNQMTNLNVLYLREGEGFRKELYAERLPKREGIFKVVS